MKRESKAKRKRRVRRNRAISIITILIAIMVLVVGGLIIKQKLDSEKKGDNLITTDPSSETTAVATTAEQTSETTAEPVTREANPDDVTGPVITAPNEVFISLGDAVSYKSLISVSDDYDTDPVIEVDRSEVNLSEEGSYTVRYTVTDASGNSSYKEITLTIAKTTTEYVSEDVIYAAADKLLETIITDDMTDLEKVFAVFFHVRDSYTYTSDTEKLEYKQEAYKFMTKKRDTCYANVCLSRLLLERLGFQSLMLTGDLGYQVDGKDQYHYWNLVSIDGGESWYVYDSAWWVWQNEEYPLCMMTAEFAQKISDRHGGLYLYDPDDYPGISDVTLWTPEEMGFTSEYE